MFFGFSWKCVQKTIVRSTIQKVELAQLGWKDSGWKGKVDVLGGTLEANRELKFQLGVSTKDFKKVLYASKGGPAVKVIYKEGKKKA